MAILISRGHLPQKFEDLDMFHKDPMYELINGAKEAYFLKYIASKLGNQVAQSEDVKELARVIENSAREMERSWRTAACMANAPVSTGYPYLPTMPLQVAKADEAHPPSQSESASGTPGHGEGGEANTSAGSSGQPKSAEPLPKSTEKASLEASIFPLMHYSGKRSRLIQNFI